MPGAVIVADQNTGAGAGLPGVARNDLWQTHQVDLSVGTTGNTSFLWELVDKPPGSSAALSSTTTATSDFTPDLIGTYRVRLITNGGGAGNIQTLVFRVRYDNMGALANRGWAYPALGEVEGESNYSGNSRAWAQVFESILEDIRLNAFSAGFTIGGDLSSSEVGQTVIGIYNRPIDGTPPNNKQIYIYSSVSGNWEPSDPDFGTLPLTAGDGVFSGTVMGASLYGNDLIHTGPVGIVTADAADGKLAQAKGVVLKKTYLQLFDGEVVDNSAGWIRLGTFYWDPDDILIPENPVVKFSAIGEVSNAANAIEIRLWDISAAAEITGSVLTTSSLAPDYKVSGALSMPGTARVLEVQMRSTSTSHTATCTSARLEIHPE